VPGIVDRGPWGPFALPSSASTRPSPSPALVTVRVLAPTMALSIAAHTCAAAIAAGWPAVMTLVVVLIRSVRAALACLAAPMEPFVAPITSASPITVLTASAAAMPVTTTANPAPSPIMLVSALTYRSTLTPMMIVLHAMLAMVQAHALPSLRGSTHLVTAPSRTPPPVALTASATALAPVATGMPAPFAQARPVTTLSSLLCVTAMAAVAASPHPLWTAAPTIAWAIPAVPHANPTPLVATLPCARSVARARTAVKQSPVPTVNGVATVIRALAR
jgi:hypothetical protein